MFILNSKLRLTAVVAAALIAGCAGGSDDNSVAAIPPAVGQSVAALVDFLNNTIDNTSENSDPIEINAQTLAVDDSAEPTPL